MSDEVKADVDSQSDEINQRDEKSEELIRKLPVNDDEENELELLTPNGRETPSATSYSDIIIHKVDEEIPVAEENSNVDDTQQLLETIADKSNKQASTIIFNMLVEGDFDLDKNYIIQKPKNLAKLFSILNKMSSSLQAEILSVLIGIMRKSERNLLACIDANIYYKLFELLNDIDDIVADLLVDILTVLTSLTINVSELKLLLRYLKTENNVWKKHAVKLLNIFKSFPYRHGPDDFFNFPGRQDSGLVLPPIKTWPYQNGFTVSTWFRIDPVANSVIEKEKPYLYWFCTSKGHGYAAHFVGNCLVITCAKPKEKNFQHCIQFEFKSREWYMITISHQYQRWAKSSIQCHINSQLVSTAYFPWSIETSDPFDKCYIGCTPDHSDLTSFSGQLSTFYLFSIYLEPLIVQGLYKLGPAYKNQFKFENESAHILTEPQRKAMYDGKLMNSIVFNYNPVSCDEQLVLQAGPKTNMPYFVHNAHAQMLSNVRSVVAHSIYSTLHSIGGVQVFFPLFGQLDHEQIDGSINYNVCSILLFTLCELIERSYTIQHQMLTSKGFLMIGYYLEKSSKQHINMESLNSLISLITFFIKIQSKNSPLLLKQLFTHIFFNPSIWINCSVFIQMRLYTYLATEFVSYNEMYDSIRPISGIIQTLNTLKYVYWIVEPTRPSIYQAKILDADRPTREQIVEMRSYMLLYMKQLVISGPGTQEEELQAILNYLHTINEDENIIDVLDLVVSLMSEHPKNMVPAFDRRLGLRTVFKLLESTKEGIRLQALKLLGFFLQRSTIKRKADAMQPHNLFSLLADRLSLHSNAFTMATYNILFEILVEKVSGPIVEKRSSEITSDWKIENSAMIKVIATLLRNSPDNVHLYDIKSRFLDDMILLSSSSRENRRVILQISVWQEYLLGLAYVYPSNEQQVAVTDRVFELLKILLHHAIKYEFGGWRVWIDTLSILHGRVTKEDYYRKINKMVENMKDDDENEPKTPVSTPTASGSGTPFDGQSIVTPTKSVSNRQVFSKTNQLPPYTISEFKYSPLHIRLLHSVFDAIESDVRAWKAEAPKPITDFINHSDNQIFCANIVHIISQMAEILCNACGGLLPLLASATSASHEIEILENTEGLSPLNAMKILKRVMSLSDLFILANTSNFSELEQEKSMPTGGILRQCLRLTMTTAVRHCMECRFQRFDRSFVSKPSEPLSPPPPSAKPAMKDPIESIIELTYLMNSSPENVADETIERLVASFIKNPESVLQDIDIQRLRAIIYRDVDDTKQTQFLALSIVYFASVLMVSRYRDIIETNQASLSRTASFMSATNSIRNGSIMESNTDAASLNGLSSIVAPITNNNRNSNETTSYDDRANTGNETDNADSQSADKKSVDLNAATSQYTSIASIPISDPSTVNQRRMSESKLPEYPKTNFDSNEPSAMNITEKLERTLLNVAPFLRDIFTEFSHILTKTLVGSHGQELLPSGLHALKETASVVELVMLLCSQEWQNSLQKHAGLAFIELVNEGRVLAHASKDHVVKVANEADFILNRMRADDIRKASEFEQLSTQTASERKDEEELCDHFIMASRQRHETNASRLREKFLAQMINDKTAYLNSSNSFWKLDPWEDDLRRRRRLVSNFDGTSHNEAIPNSSSNETEDDMILTLTKEENLLKQIKQKSQNFLPNNNEDENLSQVDEKDVDQEFSGPIRYSTESFLICGTLAIRGTLAITHHALLFDTNEDDEGFKNLDEKMIFYIDNLHGKWHFNEIRAIFSRRYLLQDKALEIFVSNRTSVMFAFTDRSIVKKVVGLLPRVGVGGRYGLPQQRRTSLASPKQLFRSANMTQRWQRREISNFEYLMYLNTISGRSYQDLNQYPIFPWIIADYESEKLDLNKPATYRDLSKPIGALNPARKSFFIERYNNWESDSIPAFHYNTHYSTAELSLHWLIRLEPFTTFYLNLHGNQFDHVNRTFQSIPLSWQNCQRDSSDVKELIPELFSLPEMLTNCNDYGFGSDDDGAKIDDVILPKWAQTSEDFIRINRAALESEFVSSHLHQWIDLIFGYKQRGPEAIRATNVFCFLTYEGTVNFDAITNPADRAVLEAQIKVFGQAPSQILTEPHPPRNSAIASNPTMHHVSPEDVSMIMKFSSNAPIIHVAANTAPTVPAQAVITISNKHDFSINKYNQNAGPLPSAYSEAAQTLTGQQAQLPLSMDSLLILNTGLHRRHLGDNFDERISQRHQSFVVTADNRFIISTGYWDKSFRVQNTDMARTTQVLYGHFDIVTCACRSEITIAGNCFIATGSRDSTVCIWIWNGTKGAIVDKEYPNQEVNPSPAAILTGHDTEIVCIWISAELGIVLSGSEHGLVLQHTLQGEILRAFENPSDMATPRLLSPSNDGDIIVCYDRSKLSLYTLNGKLMRQAIFEEETIQSLVLNADGQYTVIGGDRGFVQIIRTHDLQPIYAYPQCDASIRSLAITHDQKYIIAGLSTGCLIVFNVNFNVLNQPRRDPTGTVTNSTKHIQ
ncbi:unnamed protein product [Rotaria socialis]|uniref:Neurobeachin-like protein n=6 Tax=Rotaria TaxID=231623 RepID=A0A820RM00_9BILA|nr:unnamed protein product [Rotaria socialis]CAF4439305.1 unnamed protein product [Rotaria socialis]CAF4631699.1 unnamed protein product [Rotaria socialis]